MQLRCGVAPLEFLELPSPFVGDVRSFAAIARRVFYDQPWEVASTYVRRAWDACDVSEHIRWEEVEALLREAWDKSR